MSGVQRFRRKPTEADMIRWDGTDEALNLIGEHSRTPGAPSRAEDGSLLIWVTKSHAVMSLPLGGWAVLEPDGSGVYPLTDGDWRRLYEPLDAAPVPSMWEQEYLAVQKVLDSALGTEVEDGAGYGIAADVALVAERMKAAEAKLEVIREQIAQHVEAWAENYPEDVFPPDGTSTDAISARAMRHAYKNTARVIREHWGQDG